MVESFVDEHLGYEGTCYKACGFEGVGLTGGLRPQHARSSRDYYTEHARPQAVVFACARPRFA